MLNTHCHELLKTAAVEPLERIRRDRAEAPERIKPLLAHLEDHLFDPELNVKQLLKACGVGDNSMAIAFHSAVGQSPRRYIEGRRIETGRRLLAETDLSIWQIAELVGFSALAVFSRAFQRRTGQRPSAFRQEARERSGGERSDGSLTDEGRLSDPDWLRRVLAGGLAAAEASVVIERLLRLYPSCRGSFKRTGAFDLAATRANGWA